MSIGEADATVRLLSSRSLQISLEAIRSGNAGLNAHRQEMLNRVPATGDWSRFDINTVELRDLAYLTAKTGDEFALLRGKKEDILFLELGVGYNTPVLAEVSTVDTKKPLRNNRFHASAPISSGMSQRRCA